MNPEIFDAPLTNEEPSDAQVRLILARELPRLNALLKRTRYNFGPSAGDLERGPTGVATVDESLSRPPLARVPRLGAYRFGQAPVGAALIAGTFPVYKVTARAPSLFIVYQWAINGTSLGTTSINFAPTPENSTPDVEGTLRGDLAWQVGFGNVAYLPSEGDYSIALHSSVIPSSDSAAWMLIDATNPELAGLYNRLVDSRPTSNNIPADFVIAALGSALLVPNNLNGIRTAILVSNVTASTARLSFSGSAPSGGQGIPIFGNSQILFKKETLPEGELRAFSTAGTTLSVCTFTQDFSNI
jgi:hypothetical protein